MKTKMNGINRRFEMIRKILLGLVSFAVFAGVLLFSYGQLTAAPTE